MRTAVGLYTCAILGALQIKGNITEKLLSTLVPHIVSGVRSRNVDLVAGSYMILSQLASQVTLKNDVIQKILPVLTKV